MEENNPAFPVIAFSNYAKDLYQLTRIISYGPCKTTCFGRLKLLESKFEVHKSLNEQREASAQKVTQFTWLAKLEMTAYSLQVLDGPPQRLLQSP